MNRTTTRLLIGFLVIGLATGFMMALGGYSSRAAILSPENRIVNDLQSPAAETRLAAVRSLSGSAERMNEATINALAPLLNDTDPQVGYHAALVMGRSTAPAARSALLRALSSNDSTVRMRAAEAMSINPPAEAGATLARLLLNGDEAALQAAKALLALGSDEANNAIWTSLADDRPTSRQVAAMNALAERGEDVEPLLKQAQLSGIPSLVGNATILLERLDAR
jgi:HEAT repeat protein